MKRSLTLLSLLSLAVQSHAVIIRDDVPESAYINLGLNLGEYQPGAQYPNFRPVGIVIKNEGPQENLGTGTLIGDRWVLTAAHVIVEDDEPYPEPGDFQFQLGPDRNTPLEKVAVRAFYLEPYYEQAYRDEISDEIITKSGIDIALLELAEPITSVPPATISLGAQEADGSLIFFCGYGDFGNGITGVTSEYAVKRAFKNAIDRVLPALPVDPSIGNPPGGQLATDFDSPPMTTNTLDGEPGTVPGADPIPYLGVGVSSPAPLGFEGTCAAGDSGGPAFMSQNGVWNIVGLSAFGNMDNERYGDISVLTRVGNYTGWILSVVSDKPLGQTSPGNGGWLWKYNLGFIFAANFPWYYHDTSGWLYFDSDMAVGQWFYSVDSGWCYTSEGDLPWAFVQGEGQWRLFFDYTE